MTKAGVPSAAARAGRARLFRRCTRRFRKDRRGSVLVVVALSMVAFVSMVALVVDFGMLLLAHSEAQRAADSAALAGASAFLTYDPTLFPGDAQTTADSRAMDYATKHTMLRKPIQSGEVTVQVVLDSQKVRVTVGRPAIPLIFARVFGINTAGVSATATAEAVAAGGAPCVKPFAIPDMWKTPGGGAEDVNGNGVWDVPPCADNKCTNMEKWGFDPTTDNYQAPYATLANGNYDTNQLNASATGYGTATRDQSYVSAPDWESKYYDQDFGRRVAVKVQGGSSTYMPSYWFPWRLPGNSGAKDYTTAIAGCVPASIGEAVNSDTSWVNAEKGNMGMPTYTAIENLINSDNGVASGEYWDDANNKIAGTGPSVNPLNGGSYDPSDPRIITVALFDPTTFVASNAQSMKFVNFATFFLEDPDYVNPGMKQKAPISARYLGVVPGDAGPNKGTLVKRLRLIE